MIPDEYDELMRDESQKWIMWMTVLAVATFLVSLLNKSLFGFVAENVTINLRRWTYKSILGKDVAWFDSKDNTPGILGSLLATDIGLINGVSSEGLVIALYGTFSILCGIVIAFYFDWRISLVALGTVPFMMIGGIMEAKFQAGLGQGNSSSSAKAESLANEVIINYRTIASFGNKKQIIDSYEGYLDQPYKQNVKKAFMTGIAYGFS